MLRSGIRLCRAVPRARSSGVGVSNATKGRGGRAQHFGGGGVTAVPFRVTTGTRSGPTTTTTPLSQSARTAEPRMGPGGPKQQGPKLGQSNQIREGPRLASVEGGALRFRLGNLIRPAGAGITFLDFNFDDDDDG
eukprot:TRINITY_DN169_c0_g1_i1.p2 TRINITY_DN169_c0_g1~~TRINITY_DN169_c0_g1_i1.p2  ORF type:complete len:135 (-),score=16.68 TRINITY_DN169_c0_g1_i1:378-782(-)